MTGKEHTALPGPGRRVVRRHFPGSGTLRRVDLRNSCFCDSAGLNALLAARQHARERGTHLMLAD